MTVYELLTILMASGGAGTGIVAWFRIVRPIARGMRALLDLAQAQLSPNGGGSLVDRVCAQGEALARIEGEQAHQGQAIARIDARLATGDMRFDNHEGRIGALEQDS